MRKPLPIILSIPHAGLEAPPLLRESLAVNATTLYNECDLWADQLYDFAHPDLAAFTPPEREPGVLATVATPFSRALIDVNRAPDDLDNPDGPVKTQTSYGEPLYATAPDQSTKVLWRERYWQPFHDQLNAAINQYAGQALLLLDCHNMAQRGPSAYAYAGAARPLICLANFGDAQGEATPALGWTTCAPVLLRKAGTLAAELFSDLSLLEPALEADTAAPPVVALNWPFPGGMIIRTYSRTPAGAPRLPTIMIEVNRGLFVGNQQANSPIRAPNAPRIAMIRQRLYQWTLGVVEMLAAEKNKND